MLDEIKKIEEEGIQAISRAETIASLEEARIKYLGKKSEFTSILKSLGSLSPEERPNVGALVNTTKVKLEQTFEEKRAKLLQADQEKKIATEKIDITVPGRGIKRGKIHPLTQVMEDAKAIFIRMGFEIA